MEERVLKLLKDGRSLAFKEILNITKIKNGLQLKSILEKLENDMEIFINKKGKYSMFTNSGLVKGTLVTIKDSENFIVLEDYQKVLINPMDLNGAKDGDLVAVEIYKEKQGNKYGRVKKIKKKNKEIIGELVLCKNGAYIRPDYDKDLTIYCTPIKGVVDGLKVIVELTDKIGHNTFNSKIVSIIGHKDDPNIETLSILNQYKIRTEFPVEVLKEIESIPDSLTEEEKEKCIMSGGVDLRDELTFTLDGDDTKDYDDAITIKRVGNNYNLKVSIANVSYYVRPDTNILLEAILRGTSTYIPGANNPMLHRKLSNGICSLNPNEDRMALTFDLLFNEEGEVIDFDIYDSIINSKKRMTYSEVNRILEDGEMVEGYESYVENIHLMQELQSKIRKNKVRNGYIDLEIEENVIELDENGRPCNIHIKTRGIAEKIIEDFMVIVNEIVSALLDSVYDTRQIYRVHGEPSEEKMENFKKFIEELGYSIDRLQNFENRNLQYFLNSVKDKPEYKVIAYELLKCMKKAHYSTANIGHFALGSDSVCQVTSPIRRIGDLINHILIRDYIYGTGKGSLTPAKISYISSIASQTERNSAKCEDAVKKEMTLEYMKDHLDEVSEGIITYVCKEGFAVELDNLVEGFIHTRSLSDDKYYYNPEKFALIGKHTGNKYMLGKKVMVSTRFVDDREKEISFAIEKKVKEKKRTLNTQN